MATTMVRLELTLDELSALGRLLMSAGDGLRILRATIQPGDEGRLDAKIEVRTEQDLTLDHLTGLVHNEITGHGRDRGIAPGHAG